MYPNGKLFKDKIEFPRSREERAEQGRANDQIVLGWSEQSREDQVRAV